MLTFSLRSYIITLASRIERQNKASQEVKSIGDYPSGCGSAWLERLVWDQEVAGSNPVTPTTCGCSSMVEHQPSKLDTWVRFPSPAFLLPFFVCPLSIYAFKLSYSCFYTYLYTKQKPIHRVSTKCIGFYYALDKICIP